MAHARRAIIILESPWELYEQDANRSSVIPFMDGVAKMAGDTEVYHANFYDKRSFRLALDFLCKGGFDNAIVYVAAHGAYNKVGGVKVTDILGMIAEKSRKNNITGVLFGSCFASKDSISLRVFMEDSNIRWCAGYASTSYWLNGTLIDCSIISQMSMLESDEFADRDTMIAHLAAAISPFDGAARIGEDYDDTPVALHDSLRFVIQPKGKGQRAKDVSADIWESSR